MSPFTVSATSRACFSKFHEILKKPDSEFFCPDMQKEDMGNTAKELASQIKYINPDHPSYDRVIALANEIIGQCSSEKYKGTRDLPTRKQAIENATQELQDSLSKDMVGQLLCYKNGSDEYTYFRVSRVEVHTDMFGRYLEVSLWASVSIETDRDLKYVRLGSDVFGRDDITENLLVNGKDDIYKRWLYNVTDKQMKCVIDSISNALTQTFIQKPKEPTNA